MQRGLTLAAEACERLGMVIGDSPERDQFGWDIALRATYPNRLGALVLAAGEGYLHPGRGYAKAIDAGVVMLAGGSDRRVLLYMHDGPALYEVRPSEILRYSEAWDDNRRGVYSDCDRDGGDALNARERGACRICGGEMVTDHACGPQSPGHWPTGCARFHVWSHRLMFHDVPLAQILAVNLNRAATRQLSEGEQLLDVAFRSTVPSLRYSGDDNATVPIYGWRPDWTFGRKIVEYDGASHDDADRERRRQLAREHGCDDPLFITVTTSRLHEPCVLRAVLAEVHDYMGHHQRRLA